MLNYTLCCAIVIILVVNVKCASYLKICGLPTDGKDASEYEAIGTPFYHPNVESALELLGRPEYKNVTPAQELLRYYQEVKEKTYQLNIPKDFKRYPVIVLEGMSGTGKTTIANALAKKINGTHMHCPPEAVKEIAYPVRNISELDMAYHAIGNYIGGIELQVSVNASPIIMDRYWHSVAARAVATAVNFFPDKYQVPPVGSDIYKWPRNLLKPDLVILLKADEEVRRQRIAFRRKLNGLPQNVQQFNFMQICPQFLKNMLTAYLRMTDPDVTVINSNPPVEEVLESVYAKVKPLIDKTLS